MTLVSLRRLVVLSLALGLAAGASAQERRQLTTADYARAERFLSPGVRSLVVGGDVSPTWLADGRFVYPSQTAAGTVFKVVDPRRETSQPAFDQEALARSLSTATGTTIRADRLPFRAAVMSRQDRRGQHRRHALGVRPRRRDVHQRRRLDRARPAAHVLPDGGVLARRHQGGLYPRLEPLGPATPAPARSGRSRPTGPRTTATRPTTPAGATATAPS